MLDCNPDGILSDNEYLGETQHGDFEIHWSSDRSNAYYGIRVKTEGWVSAGFNPTNAMKDVVLAIRFFGVPF